MTIRWLAIILLTITGSLSARADSPTTSSMKLVMLGTGTPNADPDRSGPAVAIVAGGKSYLIDAGPGIVRRAAAAARKGIPELKPDQLRLAFLTHLHSDHTVGLPDLIFTSWVLERPVPLMLYGPHGTKRMAKHLEAAYSDDVNLRLHGLEPANPEGYKVDVHEIVKPGLIYKDGTMTVEAIPVLHGSWKEAYGYRFRAYGKTIVLSGDTRPSNALLEAAKGADILVHEVYSDAGFKRRSAVWQRYHASFHTSASQLAALANKAKPKLLVLYHQLYWGTSDQDLVKEIHAAGYDGVVISAKDLDVFTP
ncbi:MBL fold metallo-hydrolase [Kordiimonas marina]|uniref:MBL fold metallo-hydrolase n=1 Tax=Kordiimonas marina TaxID=2872312 RepID=UPI001FF224B8|nr:MBL fold metallo-hydrolase [Kordiimonas marina]MCJ9429376.1 MBL fold metallo-hydrolase [Kordiimonas marina]